MIRFAYPNILTGHNGKYFGGCGRFIAGPDEIPIIAKISYEKISVSDDPKPEFDKVTIPHETAYKFIKGRPIIKRYIHEYRDKDEDYFGDSQSLAFLLVLISRALKIRWESEEKDYDIWCTGEMKGSLIGKVDHRNFCEKLKAFIESPDELFIVPAYNMLEPECRKIAESKIRTSSLKELKKLSYDEMFKTKRILIVEPEELDDLVGLIFDMPEKKLWIGLIGLALAVALYFLLHSAPESINILQPDQDRKITETHSQESKRISDKQPAITIDKSEPFDVLKNFAPSGFMGDIDNIRWQNVPDETGKACVKITYTPQKSGSWAGVLIQNTPDNTGDKPGTDLRGYKKITFKAKAAGEFPSFVEFKAGGIADKTKPYRDSFEISLGTAVLEKEWKQYTIDLNGQDLSSVIGGFAFVAKGDSHPNGLEFYLADVFYEK